MSAVADAVDSEAKLSPAEFLARLRGEEDSLPVGPEADAAMYAVADGPSAPALDPDAPTGPGEDTALELAPDLAAPEEQSTGADPRDELAGLDPAALAAAAQDAGPETAARLTELFERVESLLGGETAETSTAGPTVYRPECPRTAEDTGLTADEIERLLLKYLLNVGAASGRQCSHQLKLPFTVIDPVVRALKHEQFLTFRGAAEAGDYVYQITESGRDVARKHAAECSYFGAAPVPLGQYLEAMAAQSIAGQVATEADLRAAFDDLLINEDMFERLGPAVNSGRGMFLFGEPGNGKTSIAERITRAFGTTIWIPRAITVDGDILRLFDPGVHEEVNRGEAGGLFDLSGVDPRWVNVVRPTVIAGGELTMQELEVVQNAQTKICEAPLQLKSNCGTLVIDDFGRQTMPVDVLLNRWIVPLEKRYDFLNLPSGKKVKVPFDQLIVFSTNLEPKDLVDGAFLRRIPYKIEVGDPSREEFTKLMGIMCKVLKLPFEAGAVEHLIEEHYVKADRPFRCCQPRDLLMQVRNYCAYKSQPIELTNEAFDFAVANYFSVM